MSNERTIEILKGIIPKDLKEREALITAIKHLEDEIKGEKCYTKGE